MTDIPYAEDLGHYWKTSQSSPDSWLEKTKKMITEIGGVIVSEMIGTMNGKSGILIEFRYQDDTFRILYPILPTRKPNEELAAKRQAATALFYEVKTLVVSAKFRGVRATFHAYLLLPDGRIASQLSAPEMADTIPSVYLLSSGD